MLTRKIFNLLNKSGSGNRISIHLYYSCNDNILDERTLYSTTNDSIRQLGYGNVMYVVLVLQS
jgi:hypothetical protein